MAEATVVGPTILGASCTIEPRAVVSRSVLWDRCVVGAEAVADACVLSDDAIVERRAQLARTVQVPQRRPAGVPWWTRHGVPPGAFGLRPGTAVR
jgi:NDP-sugar pyrophosphorylase family protein